MAFNKFTNSDTPIIEQLTVDLLDNRIRNRRSYTPFFIMNFRATLSKSPAPFAEVLNGHALFTIKLSLLPMNLHGR
ncbi:hypothetical protein MTO96_043746 [Rhipicephalus appendiculatus]